MVLGLVGYKGAGKSTFLKILKSLTKLPIEEIMLADKLKNVTSQVLDFKREDCEHPTKKEQLFQEKIILSADKIKSILHHFAVPDTLTSELIKNHAGKELLSIRNVLQYVGSDLLRQVDPDIHVKYSIKDTKEDIIYVVTDIRFENELEFFKNTDNFTSVAIDRPELTATYSAQELHVSEAQIPFLQSKCDILISSSSIKDFENQIKEKIINNLLK